MLISFLLKAQIKLAGVDFPKAGTNFIYAKVKVYPEKKIKISELGKESWDISAFTPQTFDTVRFKLPKKTKFGKRFPDAHLAIVINRLKMDYVRIDSSGKIYHVGLIGDFMEKNIPVLLQFNDDFVYLNTENRINIIYSDTTGSKFVAPYYYKPGTDSIKADITYRYEGRIDAKGELITPLGKFNTLREVLFFHKRVRGYKYSVFGWTPAPEYSLDKRFAVYRWFSSKSALPLAEVYVNKQDYIEEIRYQYDSPMRLSFSGKHVSCKGGSDGFIDLNVKGGIPDYTYQWSNGATTEDLKNVAAGTYNVIVTDNRGRKISGTYSVTEPLIELNASFEVKNVSCYGKKDGAVKLHINGGQEPYDFVWSNDSTDFQMTGLRPGTYSVWIKDKGGCIIKDSITITQPEHKLKAFVEKEHVSCKGGNDGLLKAIAEGGTAPYHFLWSNKDTTYFADSLKAGVYQLKVSDANGCIYNTSAQIKEPATALVINPLVKPVSCFGGNDGKITVEAKGGKPGYDYLWEDSTESRILNNLKSGNYKLKVIDRNGCIVSQNIYVPQPENPLNISHSKTDVSCFGLNNGSISIKTSGGVPPYAHQWSNGMSKSNLKKLPAGIYTLKVTDKNNCTAYDTVKITAPEKALFIDFEKKDITCYGSNTGSIKLLIEGGTPGYSVLWSDKKTDSIRSGLKAGKYSVTVTDKHHCKVKKEIILTQPDEPLRVDVQKIDPACYGQKSGSVYVKAKGGKPPYDFEWSNGEYAQNLIGLGAGKYTLTVTDKLNCKHIEIIELKQPQKLTVKAEIKNTGKGQATGSIILSINGGTKPYKAWWENKQSSLERKNLPKGYYYVTVIDANECEVNMQFEIKEE